MKSSILLTGLCLITLGSANKYADRQKAQKKVDKHVLNAPSKKRLESYDGSFCPFKRTNAKLGIVNEVCMDHQTEVRIGYNLDQSSDEESDVTYWKLRLVPYAYGEMDWKPFINLTQDDLRLYSELNAVFDDFEAGVFGEVVFWWDWTSAIGSTGNRDICVGAGYTFEEIAFALTTENFINNCYKTILSNLLDPAAAF